jgi:hypothetical protein
MAISAVLIQAGSVLGHMTLLQPAILAVSRAVYDLMNYRVL